MAFRSELDALRERADAAEAQLAAQAARMARVAEIERQLEDARRQIRESKPGGSKWRERVLPWLLLSALASGGLVWLWAQSRITSVRTEADVASARMAGESAAASARAEEATRETGAARDERDDAIADVRRANAELEQLFLLLAEERVASFVGTVSSVDGSPVPVGAECEAVRGSGPACRLELRCGLFLVHQLGCAAPPATELESAGPLIRVRDPSVGTTVWIRTGRAVPGAPTLTLTDLEGRAVLDMALPETLPR